MRVHEFSIVMGMVNEVTRIAGENNALKVTSLNLKIGRKSGIVIDSMKFAFDAVKLEYPLLTSAELLIEEIPLIYKCNDCEKKFETDDIFFPPCPYCKSFNLKLLSGEEVDIAKMELEI
jgi:hydrogenase nickel incorporation protein HypA/HybF